MTVSTRTPEGFPCRCPTCGAATKIEFSDPALGAPCPNCGNLLWLLTAISSGVPRRVTETIRISTSATAQTALPQLEHRTLVKAPQFSIRLLLVMLTTCALAFAILGAPAHTYFNAFAAMIIIFWIGAVLVFVGTAIDCQSDLWLAPASLAESIGLVIVVIALFSGAYYGVLFIHALIAIVLFS